MIREDRDKSRPSLAVSSIQRYADELCRCSFHAFLSAGCGCVPCVESGRSPVVYSVCSSSGERVTVQLPSEPRVPGFLNSVFVLVVVM